MQSDGDNPDSMSSMSRQSQDVGAEGAEAEAGASRVQAEFHGVWGKYQEGYNPESVGDRASFLTASFDLLQASVLAKPLRKENTELLLNNSRVQVSLLSCKGSPAPDPE